jgi:hypothetical protein
MVQVKEIAARKAPKAEKPVPAARQDLGLLREVDVRAFGKLREAVDTRKAALFVGSGPSASLYGDWSDLVVGLGKRSGLVPHCYTPNEEWLVTIGDLAKLADLDLPPDSPRAVFQLLDRFREKLELPELGQFLIDQFTGGRNRFEEIHTHLVRTRFDLYVTTNYDCCLESASKVAPPAFSAGNVYFYPNPIFSLSVSSRSLVHIHGRVQGTEEPSAVHVVLGESDYQDAYQGEGGPSDFMRELICGRSVVFCGFGFRDHDLFFRCLEEAGKKLLRVRERIAERGFGDMTTMTHYAFLGVEAFPNGRQLMFTESKLEERLEEFHARLPELAPGAEIVPVLYGDPYPRDPKRSHMYLTKLLEFLADKHPYEYGPPIPSKQATGITQPWET